MPVCSTFELVTRRYSQSAITLFYTRAQCRYACYIVLYNVLHCFKRVIESSMLELSVGSNTLPVSHGQN